MPFEAFLAEVGSPAGFDPELTLVAEMDGRLVGVLTGLVRSGRGWVRQLAVLADHRGLGIGEALLRSSFAMMRTRGLPVARLNVDVENESRALALYERVGMREVRSYLVYRKRLR